MASYPISPDQVRAIWHAWRRRPTIKSLAEDYETSEAMVRIIISLREEELPRD
jgi:hypothetical protein